MPSGVPKYKHSS